MKRLRVLLCAQMVLLAAVMWTSQSAIGQVVGELREDNVEVEVPLSEDEPQELSTPRLDTPKPDLRSDDLLLETPSVPHPPLNEEFLPPLIQSSNASTQPGDLVDMRTRSPLNDVFEGDFQSTLPDDLSQGPIHISVRRYQMIKTNPAGQPQRVVETSRHAVDPRSPNLTPEEKLGVFIYINESAISEKQTALFEAEDTKAREEALRELRFLYTKRFEIDTAYQDFKVREIERRAKKLRAEVNARENASRDWVEAMVTLAKMRADGIETMDSLATPSLPIQRSGFGTGVLSSPIGPGVRSPDNFKSNSFGQPSARTTYSERQPVPLPAPGNRNPSSRGARPLNALPSDQYRD